MLQPPASQRKMGFCAAVLFALSSISAVAQNSEAEISGRLLNKPFFLRGFWIEDKLTFDGSGKPEGKATPASFTVAGIQVHSVNLQGDSLNIEGSRDGLEWDEEGNMARVPLHGNGSNKAEKISIRIEGHGSQDFGPALDAIFVEKLSDLVPLLPDYWKPFAELNFLSQNNGPYDPETAPEPNTRPKVLSKALGGSGAEHIGGNVRPPKVIKSVNPKFSAFARELNYSGSTGIYLWVDPTGMPTPIRIARPAGLGLDEQAVNAASQYKFKPATQNGVPVMVDLFIDVNFQIF